MPKTKKVTIEKLASMSQREFTAIRSEVHGGFRGVAGRFDRADENVGILRRDMEAGFSGISEGMKAIMNKLNSIQEDVIEIHDLRSRVERLEKKVGLAR